MDCDTMASNGADGVLAPRSSGIHLNALFPALETPIVVNATAAKDVRVRQDHRPTCFRNHQCAVEQP